MKIKKEHALQAIQGQASKCKHHEFEDLTPYKACRFNPSGDMAKRMYKSHIIGSIFIVNSNDAADRKTNAMQNPHNLQTFVQVVYLT